MKNVFETIEVAPNVRVCSYETDRFTTGRLSININVPLSKAHVSANALVPYVLNHSCEECPSYIELNKKLASLYGASLTPSVCKTGDTQVLRLSMTMIGNKFTLSGEDLFSECAKFLFGVVFKPNLENGVFVASELEQEKRLSIERLGNEKNDMRKYAQNRMIEEMFEGEEYACNPLGTVEEIAELTPADVYAAYEAAIRCGRIQVNATGSVDVAKVAEILESYIEKIDRDPAMLFSSVVYEADSVKRIEEELPVNQGKLVMGFRAGMADPDEDYAKIKVMCDLFGGGTYSRLFSVVREKMSLCYYCSARTNRHKGFIMVQSGIENKNAEVAIAEIQNQLKYVAESITEEDLEMSKRSISDAFKTVCDTPEDIDTWLFSELMDDEIETPEMHIDKLMQVTVEDVKSAASKVTLDTIYLLKGTEEGK